MTNPNHKYFYVSARDGPRNFLMAGPYDDHETAWDSVDTVRNYAVDADGRAHFMAWGTASSLEPIKTNLGVMLNPLAGSKAS